MEDKNRELNVEELEQGVGGRRATSAELNEDRHFMMARRWGKDYKSDGHTLEEFLNDYSRQLTVEEKQRFSIEWSRW